MPSTSARFPSRRFAATVCCRSCAKPDTTSRRRNCSRSHACCANAFALFQEVLSVGDFFFVDQLPAYDPAELIPQKGDQAMALKALTKARDVLPGVEFKT